MKDKGKNDIDELRREYDFDYSKGVQGKYHRRLVQEGHKVIVVEPDHRKTENDTWRKIFGRPF